MRTSSKRTPFQPRLLFLGTEFGLWISLDGGRNGRSTKAGIFRMSPVRDIVVHPRESDLVLATHGRGIWIVDDISPLRQLTPEILAKDAVFLQGKSSNKGCRQAADGRRATARFAGTIRRMRP